MPRLRQILPGLLALAAACNGPEFAAPGGDGDPVTAPFTIQGTVLDSVTGGRLPGVHVALAGKFATTDAEGRFTLPGAPGADTVRASIQGYEAFSRVLASQPVGASLVTIDLPLRRLAPVPVACTLAGGNFSAVIVDLQGRKSLERWSESTLTLVGPGGDRTIPALDWNYQALDYLRWAVSIPDAGASVDRVDWVLFDSEGNAFRGSCEPGATPPDTTQA